MAVNLRFLQSGKENIIFGQKLPKEKSSQKIRFKLFCNSSFLSQMKKKGYSIGCKHDPFLARTVLGPQLNRLRLVWYLLNFLKDLTPYWLDKADNK